jgi:tRNA pseudouridine55 synthase
MTMQRGGTIREFCLACEGGLESPSATDAKPRKRAIAGILNIDKPLGITSHDVVDGIRRASGTRRVGHAGTLDPAASGVLLICLGQATRVTEFLMEGRKKYDAQIRLGISTDTGDSEGKVIRQTTEVTISRKQIEHTLLQFRGRLQQIPPMHSALKHKGTALYELARQGIEVERSPRLVEIYDLELTAWTPPSLRLRVECSKGTYIRALARDLGETLGTGAHLQDLVRQASGAFTLDDAISLTAAEECFANGRWPRILHPLDEALLHFEAVVLDPETETRIRQGQGVTGLDPLDGPFCRAYSSSGSFVALLRYEEERRLWQPRKVFDLHEANA